VGHDGCKKVRGTKVHVAVDPQSLPLSIRVGPGNEHDSERFVDVMEGVKVKLGKGRSKTRPGELVGDSAYDAREIRTYLRRRGIKANIPVNPRNRRRPKCGRPYRLNMETYKRMRGAVERLFSWLTGGFRRLALRWERLTSTFLGFIQLACITIYWRVLR